MTRILNEVNPPLDDALAHVGVKGMKWGVRKKRATSDQIREARVKVRNQESQINKQASRVDNAKTAKSRAAAQKKHHEMSMSYLKSPDRETASRLTTGEKVALAVIAVGIPGPGTLGAGAYAGLSIGSNRSVRKQQQQLRD